MEAAKEAIWLKGLTIESGFELKIVAGIATGALSKAVPGLRFQHKLKLLCIGIDNDDTKVEIVRISMQISQIYRVLVLLQFLFYSK